MNIMMTNDVGKNVLEALTSVNLWIAIVKSLLIISIGFVLTKTKVLPDGTAKILTRVVMMISLPCLAFASFMTSIDVKSFNSALFAFIYGFIIYILLILISKFLFLWIKDSFKRKVVSVLFVFGSTTFFGQPLILAVFPSAFNDSSMFNVAFRVFLYSYGYYAICGDSINQKSGNSCNDQEDKEKRKINLKTTFKKIFLNPIIIATFLGFGLWALQLIGDSSNTSNWWVVTVNGVNNIPVSGAFWNISVSVPWLFQTINTLGSLSSPLVWIAIGCTLGKVSIREAAQDKIVWIYSILKVVFVPIINLVFLYLLNLIPGITVSFNTLVATTLMFAVPSGAVALSYCISCNKEAALASSCSLISTFVSVVLIPLYIVMLTLIQNVGIFN